MFGILSTDQPAGVLSERGGRKIEFFPGGFFSISDRNERFAFMARDNSGKKALVFEGRLYGGRACLRREEISRAVFSAYEASGIDFPSGLEGEFILGLWDGEAGIFALARDKFGARQVYYSARGSRLMFSSEIRNFFRSGFTAPDVDCRSLDLYLSFMFVPSPHTIFKGICKLPCASMIIWKDGQLQRRRYWEIPVSRRTGRKSPARSAESCELLLTESVEKRCSGGAGVCAYLSGGVDSSLVAGLAAESGEKRLSAFCAGGEGRAGDLAAARAVASRFKISDYHEVPVGWRDMAGYLPRITELLEEPTACPSGLYLYMINLAAKERGGLILSGEGADVLFGGHSFCYRFDAAHRFSRCYPKSLVGWLAGIIPSPSLSYRFLALRDMRSPGRAFLDVLGPFPKAERERLLTGAARNAATADADAAIVGSYFRRGELMLDSLARMLIENHVADLFLMRANKLALACGIEHAPPFLDGKLVAHAFSVRAEDIYDPFNEKRILKAMLKKRGIPRAVGGGKRALVVPGSGWLRNGLAGWACSLLESPAIADCGFFSLPQVRMVLRRAGRDLRAQYQLWALVTFALWFAAFISNENES